MYSSRDLARHSIGDQLEHEQLEREQRQRLEREQRHQTGPGDHVDRGNQLSGVNAQRNVGWLPAWLPLSDQATCHFLSKVTDTAVMGLVTLATFSATYLLAWGKPGTCCIPGLNSTKNSAGKDLKNPGPSWPQIFAALLPFVVFPIALYLSGIAKQAETEKRVLSSVAWTCLCEFTLPIALGAWMSYCMTGYALCAVLGVTAFLILGVTWGLTFKYPKCLRYFIWTICFRQAEVDQPNVLKVHDS